MKCAVALVVLVICTIVNGQIPINLSEQQKINALQYSAECFEKEHSTTEAATALIKGQFDGLDKNAQCFANCFLQKAGFISNGVPQPEVLSQKLGPNVGQDKLDAIMAKCNSLKGSDNCETAFVLYQCYYKEHATLV
ncbi:general odorant-binding protein 56d-like [Musca vetustissima]|uniref:general odorant-binding protein 56d-like n=1 Tax=Musca vetustissima TaxID=27455 RepID=UPI002AB68713|nr:general odorant-binding protein 56d-like [Musca vetustissima]